MTSRDASHILSNVFSGKAYKRLCENRTHLAVSLEDLVMPPAAPLPLFSTLPFSIVMFFRIGPLQVGTATI